VTAAYDAIDAIRWSNLRELRTSPKHYRHALVAQRERTTAMLVGTAIHTAVLEPHLFASRHPVFDGVRRGKTWDAFVVDHPGAEILNLRETELVMSAAGAVLRDPIAQRHMRGSHTEHTITWTDAETGALCKGRVDLVNGHLVELKSTGDAMPRRFAATAARLGYHGQIAYYLDGLAESGYATEGDPAIITVEQSAPWDVVVYTVPDTVIDLGRQLYRSLLRRLVECTERDEWPGIAEQEIELMLPAWASVGDDVPSITLGGEVVIQ